MAFRLIHFPVGALGLQVAKQMPLNAVLTNGLSVKRTSASQQVMGSPTTPSSRRWPPRSLIAAVAFPSLAPCCQRQSGSAAGGRSRAGATP